MASAQSQVLAAVAMATLALPALADVPVPAGGVYTLAPARTHVRFSVSQLGLITYHGDFHGASGRVRLDPANPGASRIDVDVPVAGLTSSTPWMRDALRGSLWLDATRFPTMTFHSTTVTPTGQGTADVEGALTMHGVTRAVTFKARFRAPTAAGGAGGFEVKGQIRRSEFGMRRYAHMISDTVELSITAAFEPTAS
jgi:polyisoprenoid-binding protein YceI